LHKDVKLTSGTNIDQTGKISGTLRGEAKLSTISISSGVETSGELSKNKYDAKLSGEVFKGFKVNAGVDI
jgi:hypothetical protein